MIWLIAGVAVKKFFDSSSIILHQPERSSLKGYHIRKSADQHAMSYTIYLSKKLYFYPHFFQFDWFKDRTLFLPHPVHTGSSKKYLTHLYFQQKKKNKVNAWEFFSLTQSTPIAILLIWIQNMSRLVNHPRTIAKLNQAIWQRIAGSQLLCGSESPSTSATTFSQWGPVYFMKADRWNDSVYTLR